jgi:hypothetical protein
MVDKIQKNNFTYNKNPRIVAIVLSNILDCPSVHSSIDVVHPHKISSISY